MAAAGGHTRARSPTTVTLLATGGTVSTVTAGTGRTSATLSAGDLAAALGPDLPGVAVSARDLSRVPSWQLDPPAMAEVALAARDAARDVGPAGGVVVTHGTSTLEYTAFLADLVVDATGPVVFTGAMRRADEPEPDGPRNLRDAMLVASSTAARNGGSLVVFHGRVIAGDRAWKARRSDSDAFVDLDGDLGAVSDGTVTIGARERPWAPFSGRLEPRVAFVKVVPGMDGRLVTAATETAEGLVVEALPGAGGIPPAMVAAVRDGAARIPVVIASRAPYGTLPEVPTGGTGEMLSDLGLLSAGRLTGEQAWLLLMAALADGRDPDDIRARFRSVALPTLASTRSSREMP